MMTGVSEQLRRVARSELDPDGPSVVLVRQAATQ
jgi:hypothetical protein